jgi:hypothetical protein
MLGKQQKSAGWAFLCRKTSASTQWNACSFHCLTGDYLFQYGAALHECGCGCSSSLSVSSSEEILLLFLYNHSSSLELLLILSNSHEIQLLMPIEPFRLQQAWVKVIKQHPVINFLIKGLKSLQNGFVCEGKTCWPWPAILTRDTVNIVHHRVYSLQCTACARIVVHNVVWYLVMMEIARFSLSFVRSWPISWY